MDKDLAGQVADVAHRVVASGAISANGLRAAALQRVMTFDRRGTVHA